MKLPKCVIFDFDGVIVDSDRNRLQIVRKACSEFGVKLPGVDIKKYVGKRNLELLNDILGSSDIETLKKIVERARAMRIQNMMKKKTISGLKELLKFLKKAHIKICIASQTAREPIESFLKKENILDYFDFMITQTEFPHTKNERIFKAVTDKMKIPPKDCIVIEDSPRGISAAKKAGCQTFGIRTYLNKKDLGMADRTFKDHIEIKKFLSGLK